MTTSNTPIPASPAPWLRLVCPHCGSPDLVEEALGHRRFDVTYYADGGYDDRSGDAWEIDTWENECNSCGASLRYDHVAVESPSPTPI